MKLKALFFIAIIALASCKPGNDFKGRIYGTSYSIIVSPGQELKDRDILRKQIQSELLRLDRIFSSWKKDSEVSRLNASRLSTPLPLSPEMREVLAASQDIHQKTGGVFDPTVSPLIQLWGFGTKSSPNIPTDAQVQQAKSQVGFDKLQLNKNALTKTLPELSLNLSALAKGYAVDRIALLIEKLGHKSYMVEIGGEVRVGQAPPGKKHWRIGIEKPNYTSPERKLLTVAALTNVSMATSGDYRNYYNVKGTNYSHILDPRTGKPKTSPVRQATVIGPDCMRADALATALIVMDPQAGRKLVESLPDYEAMLLYREKLKRMKIVTKGFPAYLQ